VEHKPWLDEGSVFNWRQRRILSNLTPLLQALPGASWLTVGDGYGGNDARFVNQRGGEALATDVEEAPLREAVELKRIPQCGREDAEDLSFEDESFDFVLCKEALHHCARPMVALYELLRVCRTAVVLIEPYEATQAPLDPPDLLLRVRNTLRPLLGKQRITRGDDFEPVGNFIYRFSERELEKAAIAIGMHSMAFKKINDYHDYDDSDRGTSDADAQTRKIRKARGRIAIYDALCRLRLQHPGLLCAVIFKQPPGVALEASLIRDGYKFRELPQNPYA